MTELKQFDQEKYYMMELKSIMPNDQVAIHLGFIAA